MLRVPKKVVSIARALLKTEGPDDAEKAFIRHNQKIWKNYLRDQSKGEVLVEWISMSSSLIAFSYVANLLAKIHSSRMVVYSADSNNIFTRLMKKKVNRIYRSFNASKFIYHELTDEQSAEVDRLFDGILPSLKTKRDVEDLKLEGVWIGDLLYDSHCLNYQVPTITITDQRFHESLRTAIVSYIFWRDYLRTHSVMSVILSHTVYVASGVVTRLAIEMNIPVYHVNATHVHYLTKRNLWAYDEFFYYPEQFSELSEEERNEGLKTARERLARRFSGEVGVDMHYSTKSAYGRGRKLRVLQEGSKTKILVATHCFFDNPHPYGVNLFPDFYEWLYFLGEISKKTDYEWYIKTHPDFLPGNVPIIKEFISKYPKFTMIPSDTSHLQLVEEGIDYGLTVYGTIGFEYAALGIPVINASLCNPRIRYNFNIHPKTIKEYENLLLNIKDVMIDIDLNEVYEYYFMAFIYKTNDWLFQDYDDFLKNVGGYYNQFTSSSYNHFISEHSGERHTRILGTLWQFLESEEYSFSKKHMFYKKNLLRNQG